MSCYHPFVGVFDGDYTDRGKKKYNINGHIKLEDVDKWWFKEEYTDYILIPCGKCIGCRLDYSRKWADRMMLELESSKSAVFLTLTYDNKHLVNKDGVHAEYMEIENYNLGSLYKRHLQLFMKSLRKCFDRQNIKLKFYGVGEYGSWKNTHRPHYHIILFGIGLSDFINKRQVGFNELKQPVYTHACLSALWPHGFVSIGDVSWRSCAYVSRYVTKKALDVQSDLTNEALSLNPIFSVMSRRPGLGAKYLIDNPDCLNYQNIYVSSPDGSVKISLPKYFLEKLRTGLKKDDEIVFLQDVERYDKIMAERMQLAKDSKLLKLMNTDLGLNEQLLVEEKEKLNQVKSLRRYV